MSKLGPGHEEEAVDPRDSYWYRRTRTGRFTRRRLLGAVGTVGFGTAGFALVGCGDDDDDDGGGNGGDGGTTPVPGSPTTGSSTPAATPTPGNREGIWRWHQATPMATINPTANLDSLAIWGMSVPIYDHLFAVAMDVGVPENFLADTVEMQDQTNFVIKIKQSVWNNKPPVNGRAVTAEDLQKTFLGVKNNAKYTKDPWWTNTLDTIEVIDEKTIKVHLTKPDSWTFTTQKFCSSWTSSILPKEHTANPDLMNTDLIGSGLYEFVSHENGTNLKVKRNETYRVKNEPNLAGIQTRLIQEPAAALAAFTAGELDSYWPQNKLEKDQLVQKMGKDVQITTSLSNEVWTLVTRGDGQWADPRIQQALSLAMDRKEMIDLLVFGEGEVTGPVPPGHGAWALSEQEIAERWGRFDPAEAKKRLAATAFDVSKEYSLKYYTGRDKYSQWCEIVASQLKKNLGLNIKLVAEDFGTWYTKSLLGSDFQLIAYPSIAYDSPAGFLGTWDDQGYNWTKFSNPETTALIRKMEANYDVASRQQQGKELQKLSWDTLSPWIPTFVGQTYTAYQKWVKGLMRPGTGSYGYLVGSAWFEKH